MAWGWFRWLTRTAPTRLESPAASAPPRGSSDASVPLRVVARGGAARGVSWTVLAGPDPYRGDELLTFVARERAGHRAQSGMGGPRLPHGGLINTWQGTATGLPPFVLLRADPSVGAVTVHTARGHCHQLELSDTDEELGLRFAAGPLDDGDDPIALTAVLTDGSSFTSGYRRP